jgi:uncharacterized membrane protein (UPF0127 family)
MHSTPNNAMKASRLSCLILALTMLASCSARAEGSPDISKPNPPLETVAIESGGTRLLVELAVTEQERNRGLMYRKTLEDGKGMLFVFEYDQKLAFWMKNTSLPLSLAYLGSDGSILQILDLVPFSLEGRSSTRSARYALEVPQGWFDRAGLKVGDRFAIPPLKKGG